MTESVAFQTRARTIDHLGREQIADVPTAISELWKNSYDAYAKEVALHIFDENPNVAVIADDGHGMTKSQFLSNWLVVGTESKTGKEPVKPELRQGLKERPKQGQKGIGRLSVAALGVSALIVSKQQDSSFVACLVDWRLFENPYIYLHDITLPVVEFKDIADLPCLFPSMQAKLLENLGGTPPKLIDGGELSAEDSRSVRLRTAWEMFDRLQTEELGVDELISQGVRSTAETNLDVLRFLDDWGVSKRTKKCGTAVVITEINPSLAAWFAPELSNNADEADSVKTSLLRTLSGFSDPYDSVDNMLDYRVVVHAKSGPRTVVSREKGYGIDFLKGLDHSLIGSVDECGIFSGRVTIFGKDFGSVTINPATMVPTANKDRVGPFALAIGAYEPVVRSSSMSEAAHSDAHERAAGHSGLNVYRDGLRVMPYGRPESDFFKIEERRQSHAGREFWASRRMFGRISITRENNPNLRDKAGREGLIDNAACRAIQSLIIDLLRNTARRYFGTDAPPRKELLPGVEADNDAAAAKAKSASGEQLSNFKKTVKEQTSALESALGLVIDLGKDLESIVESQNVKELWEFSAHLDKLSQTRGSLKLPPRPKKLGRFEEQYRKYRDDFVRMASIAEDIKLKWAAETARLEAKPAIDVAKSRLYSSQSFISDKLIRWKKSIGEQFSSEQERITESIDSDLKAFYQAAAPLVLDLEMDRSPLGRVLSELDKVSEDLLEKYSDKYDSYLRSMKQLASGVDLDGAFAYAGARAESLEKRIEQVQSLAQVGISVEILGHELLALDRRLEQSLNMFPPDIKASQVFLEASWAKKELVERLRFLSRLQISGSDVRQRISGTDVQEYLMTFFRTVLSDRAVELIFTSEFLSAAFYEYPSRIFPVFINLINNSLYWLREDGPKLIKVGVINGDIIVADNGPGIDPEDVTNLFELFFTRRIRGRGVGLYLCRQTLMAGGHSIAYAQDDSRKILPGANFVITLRNGFDA